VDDKTLEELEFHQETVAADANSPLHLIREKEMEISGRVLAAKQEAEEIVAKARKRAVETVEQAEAEGNEAAKEEETRILAEVQAEVEQVKASTQSEKESLNAAIGDRTERAVEHVVHVVKQV
jgi:vacuolar-type H+-ATPase subunit H